MKFILLTNVKRPTIYATYISRITTNSVCFKNKKNLNVIFQHFSGFFVEQLTLHAKLYVGETKRNSNSNSEWQSIYGMHVSKEKHQYPYISMNLVIHLKT